MPSNIRRLCFSTIFVFLLLDFAVSRDIQAFFQGNCLEDNFCDDNCVPMDNGYFCECREGHVLSNNGFSCLKIPVLEENPVVDEVLNQNWPSLLSSDTISLSSSEQLVIKPAGQKDQNDQTGKPDDQSNSLSQNNGHNLELDTNDHIMAKMFDLKEKSVKGTHGDVLNGVGEPLSLIHRPSCHGVVCQNNGTCVIDRSIVRCNCPIGTSGRRCEKQ